MVRRIENGVLEDARSVGVGQEDRKFSNSMRLSRAHRRQILSSDRENIGSRIRLPLFIFASQNRRTFSRERSHSKPKNHHPPRSSTDMRSSMSRMCKPVASCPYFSELAVGFQPFVLPWDARCLHKAAQKTISRNGDVTQYFFGKGDYVIAVYLFHGVTHRIDYI
jgi:hypothetical protein